MKCNEIYFEYKQSMLAVKKKSSMPRWEVGYHKMVLQSIRLELIVLAHNENNRSIETTLKYPKDNGEIDKIGLILLVQSSGVFIHSLPKAKFTAQIRIFFEIY